MELPERLDDPRWHEGLLEHVTEDIRSSLEDVQRLEYFRLIPLRHPTLARKFAQLRESGVVLLIGTDSGVPLTFHSDSTWRELDYWVRLFGVPAMDALRAATYWPAVHMRVEKDVGTIAEGKLADVIAVRGDLLTYIDRLQSVDLVIRKGIRYK
jgi:imidazolonepropionase-like amidohydrolase